MELLKTEDIKNEFYRKLKNNDFRIIYKGSEYECKTLEIQAAHFEADKDWIIRKPNYDYINRELQWYDSQSLNVNDIPGETPIIWKNCSDKNGIINSNYGWCIYSPQNFLQYQNCLNSLLKDNCTRQAVMIYNRPSMQYENSFNSMHDFMCTFSTQVFLNDDKLDYIVCMRSNDAIFGYNNDVSWHKTIQERLCKDLTENLKRDIVPGKIIWNANSLHIYERHFKFLENQNI